jgi:subtilisin family serine protease
MIKSLFLFVLAFSATSTFGKPYIIEADNLDVVKREVLARGGAIKRSMTHVKALVVELSAAESKKLQQKHPGVTVYEDIELHAIAAKAAGKPAGGSVTPPAQTTPWGIVAIHANETNAAGFRGEGAIVCVVDTGIDKTHPDLAANIIGGRNFVVAKGKVDPSAWNDDNGHGSHVAGTIAALDNNIGVVGVAPRASLLGVKVLDRNGSGLLSGVTDGILECVARGAHVINMSLGGNGDPSLNSPMHQAIQTAVAQGIQVIVAAGNEGESITGKVPAGYDEVIAVAAVDNTINFPSWSNFDLTDKDITAPGVNIPSTWKGGVYNTISGTSMATPHVAGVAALAVSAGLVDLASDAILTAPSTRQGSGLVNAVKTVTP